LRGALVSPLFRRTGVPTEPYLAFTPDILLRDDETLDLRGHGVHGVARHTPAHTAASATKEAPDIRDWSHYRCLGAPG
jgi:glyoxylase-like metal-dependent hydrolase (beta-lactamase superfamily II)